METLMERLTTSEAAVAAGVSVPQIHRIIDEKADIPHRCVHSDRLLFRDR